MLHENARLSNQRLELVDLGINKESKSIAASSAMADISDEIIYINVFNKSATKATTAGTGSLLSQARLSVF